MEIEGSGIYKKACLLKAKMRGFGDRETRTFDKSLGNWVITLFGVAAESSNKDQTL